jgi:hypothetical protein
MVLKQLAVWQPVIQVAVDLKIFPPSVLQVKLCNLVEVSRLGGSRQSR